MLHFIMLNSFFAVDSEIFTTYVAPKWLVQVNYVKQKLTLLFPAVLHNFSCVIFSDLFPSFALKQNLTCKIILHYVIYQKAKSGSAIML